MIIIIVLISICQITISLLNTMVGSIMNQLSFINKQMKKLKKIWLKHKSMMLQRINIVKTTILIS